MLRKLLLIMAVLLPTAAQAQSGWRTATSNNFIVYSQGDEAAARDVAIKLEKFYFLLRYVTGGAAKSVPAPIKAKIYMVGDREALMNTMAFRSDTIAGYYSTGERGPYAVMSRASNGGEFGLSAQTVLFHELTHHFMFMYHPAAYPSWYIEGFADYYGATLIKAHDAIEVGEILPDRYLAFTAGWMPVQKLLTAKSYADVGDQFFHLYAEGWLLVHYCMQDHARGAMLQKYLHEINDGVAFDKAASDAFGDLNRLNRDLRSYAQASRSMKVITYPFKPIDPGAVVMRTLTPAENAMLSYEIALHSGVPAANAATFVARARGAAAAFPDDPYALRIVAEAQRLAGQDDDARRTVAHWLKVAPRDPMALMQQGALQIDALVKAKNTDATAWTAARAPILDANRLMPHDPQILRAVYHAYSAEGGVPPTAAQDALLEALDLTPLDDDIRYLAARDFELRGDIDNAIGVIRPAAYHLHSDADKTPAQKAKEEHLKEKYRLAGEKDTSDTPAALLARLEKKQAGGNAPPPGATPAPAKS